MKKLCVLLATLLIFSLPFTVLANELENNYITRAEFVKEVLTAANINVEEVSKSSFDDVTNPEYISSIETAYKNGLISGYGTLFKPDNFISKDQAIAIIVKVFGEKAGLKLISEEDINKNLSFSHNLTISAWAKPSLTYALKYNMVKQDNSIFHSNASLTKAQASSLIIEAKAIKEKMFIREGLSASELLVVANEKNSEYTSFKQKGTMDMNMKMLIEGIPQAELEKNSEMKDLLGNGIDMVIDIDMHYQNPDKAYIIESIKTDGLPMEANQEIEILMDGSMMYTRMKPGDKWVAQDMSSILNQIQSISNNDPFKMSKLSERDLELFKEYARYENDTVLDNTNYYVISIFIDKEAFKKYYMEIMDKTMESVIKMQTENPQLQSDPTFNPELYKQMMVQMVSQMEIEVGYKYYINKETKGFEKLWVSQDVYIPMDQLIATLGELTQDENAKNMSIKMLNHSEGTFSYYNFNGEVVFPVINPEDIMK